MGQRWWSMFRERVRGVHLFPPPACTTRDIGVCTLFRCSAATQAQAVDAGKVTIDDGTTTVELTEAWQTENGILTSETPITYSGFFTLPWAGGETLTVNVSGSNKKPVRRAAQRCRQG